MRKFLLFTFSFLIGSPFVKAQGACDDTEHSAFGTVYFLLDQAGDSEKSGNCSFVNEEIKPYYAALKDIQYATADYCGVCAEVTGPLGTEIVRIVDKCPTCTGDWDLDLSPTAFEALIGPANQGGHVAITWKEVPCPLQNNPNIIVSTEGTNEWYAKLVIYHHTNDITKVEIEVGNTWFELERTVDNGWVSNGTEGLNASNNPHRVRITDKFDEEVIVTGIDLAQPNTLFNTTENFTACSITVGTEEVESNHVKLFPNPTDGQLTISGVEEGSKVTIVNTLGEEVYSMVLNSNVSQQINLDGLAGGVYMVNVLLTSGNSINKQLVIK